MLSFSCEESRKELLPAALKKATEEDDGEIQEATASLPAAKEISVDVPVVLSGLDGIFPIKRRTKSGTGGFSWWKTLLCFSLLYSLVPV